MGKTVNVSGFLTAVSVMEVRQIFERITGLGTIHTIRLRETKRAGIFHVLVQLTQETHTKELLKRSSEVNTPYRLSFYECKYEIDSNKASMEHDIDGVLMYFGFLESPEKLRYMYRVCACFGICNHNLHFLVNLSEKSYQIELPYENVGQIE